MSENTQQLNANQSTAANVTGTGSIWKGCLLHVPIGLAGKPGEFANSGKYRPLEITEILLPHYSVMSLEIFWGLAEKIPQFASKNFEKPRLPGKSLPNRLQIEALYIAG